MLPNDRAVCGALLLVHVIFPDCGSALTGCGLPLGLFKLDAGFGTALFKFKGFKLAFVAGTLRAQAEGMDDTSEDESALEMVNVSFKSEFDRDNTLDVEDADDVELVRRRRGWTPKPGGLIPL